MTDIELEKTTEMQPVAAPASVSLSVLRGPVRPDLLRDELLAEIFASTVAAGPGAVAMSTMERKLTYAHVDHEATALARGLIRRGIRPGDVVGLWGPRGPELLISQIAIAKTGAAWLPFDADAPVERIDVCLRDCEAKALLTSEAFAAKAKGGVSAEIVTGADLIDPSDSSLVDARKNGATPDHPAYMIYTSGSTGTPKGIVITGRNICHYLRSANETYKIGKSDIVFQGASIAFDLSMEEIWIPYLAGATLFVATPAVMGEAEALPDLMEEVGVTVLDTVPTLLSLMPRDIKTLRVIILGGEACPPAVAARWCRPGRTIFNSYGPTEATVVATVAEVHPDQPVTIGGPIANYTCYVADEANNLLARGVEGELLIGGPGVAPGYLKRDALTAEKFIANPFDRTGTDPILYRSGDAVAMMADGNIAFRGRIDDQVKIRGFRVELGEIESKLADQPGVNQAAVVLRNDEGMDQLVAFLVAEKGETLDPKKLRADLRAGLPAYMVPARYEMRDALPRLSSGKVNRNALKKEPLAIVAISDEEQEEPQTPTEAILLDAAKKVLPPQAIPFDADFFTDLGGHSLLAARFVSLVRLTPSLASITLQDMYTARNLRAIALLMDEKSALAGAPKDLSFTPPPLLRRFLCGLAQAVCLPFLLALSTAQWLGIFVSYMLLTDTDASIDSRNHLAARRLCHRPDLHRHSRHRDKVAGDWPFQAGSLSDLGRLLFPLVAGAAHAEPHPHQVAAGLAADARLPGGARREGWPGRQYFRTGNRRGRSGLDRRGHDDRRARQTLQCHVRRGRHDHRPDRHRPRLLYRLVLRHRGSLRAGGGRRAARPHSHCAAYDGRRLGNMGRIAWPLRRFGGQGGAAAFRFGQQNQA